MKGEVEKETPKKRWIIEVFYDVTLSVSVGNQIAAAEDSCG